jgi:NADH-quinone oxidoreductase subunit J
MMLTVVPMPAVVPVISIVLFIAVIAFAIMAVSFKDLLSAAISLAALSAALAIIFYRLNSPYAAVIELSVCAGLITALFVAAISLTRRR